MKVLQLQYPDSVPLSKVKSDLLELSRSPGQAGNKAVIALAEGGGFSEEELTTLQTYMTQRGIPYNDTDAATAALSSTQAIVEDGAAIEITDGSVEFTVEDGAITGGTFTGTP